MMNGTINESLEWENKLSPGLSLPHGYLIPRKHSGKHIPVSKDKSTQQAVFIHSCSVN